MAGLPMKQPGAPGRTGKNYKASINAGCWSC